jgi:hypothetical protein
MNGRYASKTPSLGAPDMRTPRGRDRRLGRYPCSGRSGRHPSRRERSWYRSTARCAGCRVRMLRIGEPPSFGTGCPSLPGCAGPPNRYRKRVGRGEIRSADTYLYAVPFESVRAPDRLRSSRSHSTQRTRIADGLVHRFLAEKSPGTVRTTVRPSLCALRLINEHALSAEPLDALRLPVQV